MTDELKKPPLLEDEVQPSADAAAVDKPEYLGDRKVKFTKEEGDFMGVVFEDGTQILLHTTLYDIIVSEEPCTDRLTDLVYSAVSKILFKQVVDFGLTGSDVENISLFLNNLAVNSYNKATKLLWGDKNPDQVALAEIMDKLDTLQPKS